jgi:hypothetical protein
VFEWDDNDELYTVEVSANNISANALNISSGDSFTIMTDEDDDMDGIITFNADGTAIQAEQVTPCGDINPDEAYDCWDEGCLAIDGCEGISEDNCWDEEYCYWDGGECTSDGWNASGCADFDGCENLDQDECYATGGLCWWSYYDYDDYYYN